MKLWIGIVAALLIETQAHAQTDTTSAKMYYPSCLVAADIVQGKHPAADFNDQEVADEMRGVLRKVRDTTIQRLMGHRNIGTTALYCEVSEETMRKAVEFIGG